MVNLEELDKIVVWMRAKGVHTVRIVEPHSQVAIELGPPPEAAAPEIIPMSDDDAAAAFVASKEQLERLLFASSEGFPEDEDE